MHVQELWSFLWEKDKFTAAHLIRNQQYVSIYTIAIVKKSS